MGHSKTSTIINGKNKRVPVPKELEKHKKILNELIFAKRQVEKLRKKLKPLGSIINTEKEKNNVDLLFDLGNFLTDIDLGIEAGRFFYEAAHELKEKKEKLK